MLQTGSVVRPLAPTSVLGKAFDVLEVFTPAGRLLTVTEVSRKSGLPKSTTHRLLAMLCEVGAVERERDCYRVGLRMLSISSRSPEAAVRHAAMPFLLDLHHKVRHTVHLCALRGGDVVYLEKLQAAGAATFSTQVGMMLPAHCTGVGKALLAASPPEVVDDILAQPLRALTARSIRDAGALLAELRTVRSRGFAADVGESAVGLSCVARCISVGPQPVVAVSIGFPDGQHRPGIIEALTRTVVRIERALRDGERPTPPRASYPRIARKGWSDGSSKRGK